MKKYLFLAIAALGFAACSDSDLNGGKDPIHKGEIEESYIAINLSASDITRAEGDPVFEDGTEAERKVHHADFFFFDGDGNAFPVTIADGGVTSPGVAGGVNHLTATGLTFSKDSETTDGDDISDSSNAVLLLKTYKGEYPSQIVAVLNWSPDPSTAYSLGELKQAVNLVGSGNAENHFIMSNAVYAQGSTEMYATPLTIDNIKNNADAAKASPVTIYVERVAAKVTVNIPADKLTNGYDLDKEYVPASGGPAQKVYAQVLGWDLYRDNTQSYLLKHIDSSWVNSSDFSDPKNVGFNWNDPAWYRSYWATSLDAPTTDPIYGTSPFAVGKTAYIGENTTENNTKVVIKAKLVNAGGTAVEIAHWNNVEYAGNLALRTAVANTLKNTYYALNGTTYTGILPDDLQCVAGGSEGAPTGVKANEVYFQLSADGKNKDWYKLVNGEYKNVADNIANDQKSTDAMNAALKSVPSAVLYTNGETFYYVDIKHLGAANSAAEFGIVRNHAYNITINSIKGYGSPVYTGTEFVDYPSTPDQNTFVSAKINILSWRLVDQEVDIQPQS